jgi:hypothetical protein
MTMQDIIQNLATAQALLERRVSRIETLEYPIYDISCRVYHSVAQALVTAVITTIAFDTEVWDTDNIHDNAFNNSRLTCTKAGLYWIGGGITYAAHAVGRRMVYIYLNAGTYLAAQTSVTNTEGATHHVALGTIYKLIVGDFVELRGYQTSGGNLNANGGAVRFPWFGMTRIL